MLIEFSIANYLSFKDRVTLSMLASPNKELEDSNVFQYNNKLFVKSAVIYGANASGKSNLLNAFQFMRRMVISSAKDTQVNEKIDVMRYKLSAECDDKPSFLEISFAQDNTIYRYGFEVDENEIHSEWLFSTSSTKEAQLFVRTKNQIVVNSTHFKEGKGLDARTRNNALFLSVCAQFNGEVARKILQWFKRLKIFNYSTSKSSLSATIDLLKDAKNKNRIMELMSIADLGISDIMGRKEEMTIEHLPKKMPALLKKMIIQAEKTTLEIKTLHNKFDNQGKEVGKIEFDLGEESGGTAKLIMMAGMLIDVIENGRILLIDELDAQMHHLLSRALIRMFNSSANQSNAQLICSTHDTTLLQNSLFRRDQIWFTEKDKYGSSELYSLIEIKGVRKENSFGKDYLQGKYGAIPFVGDLSCYFE